MLQEDKNCSNIQVLVLDRMISSRKGECIMKILTSRKSNRKIIVYFPHALMNK